MKYSSRFWLYAPITLFLLVAAGVSWHWHVRAQGFEQKLATLKGREAVPGIVLDWSSVAVGGFPFRLEASFTGFSATGAGAHGPFAWTTEKFVLHELTYGRATIVYEAAGRQHLAWTDGGGGAQTADFLPGTLHASSTADARGLMRFDLDIRNAAGDGFTAERLQFHLRRDPDGQDLDLMVKADALRGAGGAAQPVQAYVTLTQSAQLAPLLAGVAAWPDAVHAWHGHDGEMRLTQGIDPDRAARALSALY